MSREEDQVVSTTSQVSQPAAYPTPAPPPPGPTWQELQVRAAAENQFLAANQQHQYNQGTFSGKP
jgi:hypothetical protein